MIVAKIIYMAVTVLIHYEIITICFMGLVAFRAFKRNSKALIRSVIAFSISVAILVGIPMGIVEAMYPKETKGDTETAIIKEVERWMP
jgi:hypothetical protein